MHFNFGLWVGWVTHICVIEGLTSVREPSKKNSVREGKALALYISVIQYFV
jgi:hypothetical protein